MASFFSNISKYVSTRLTGISNGDGGAARSAFEESASEYEPQMDFKRRSRAPDPTAGRKGGWGSAIPGKRGVATVNLKHRARVSDGKRLSRKNTNNSSQTNFLGDTDKGTVQGSAIHQSKRNNAAAAALLEGASFEESTKLERGKVGFGGTLPRGFKSGLNLSATLGRKKKHDSLKLKGESSPASPQKLSTSQQFSAELMEPVLPEGLGHSSDLPGSPKSPSTKFKPSGISKSPRSRGSGRLEGVSVPYTASSLSAKKKTFTGNTRKTSDISDGSFKPENNRSTLASLAEEKPSTPEAQEHHAMKTKYLTKLFHQAEKNKDKRTSQKDMEAVVSTSFSTAGSSKEFKFKQAMVEKLHSFGGLGSTEELGLPPMLRRKGSSFATENPTVLILGKSKAGKSTLFKQMLSMAGHPPNYSRAYIPTRAPIEKELIIDDKSIRVIDVGGSKSDIVNWRFHLSQAELIVFVVALDEYDKLAVSSEEKKDGKKSSAKPLTHLQESLELFDSIINNVALLNSRVVLMLNKADRFKKRLTDKKISLADVGVYENAPQSLEYEESLGFIENMFLEKADMTGNTVQIEVTSASDAEACGDVINRLTHGIAQDTEVAKLKNLL